MNYSNNKIRQTRPSLKTLALAISCALGAGISHAETLQAVADKSDGLANGKDREIIFSTWNHAFYKFDVQGVSNIDTARLRVYYEGKLSLTAYAYPADSDDWSEDTPTPRQIGFSYSGIDALDQTSSNGAGYMEFDVTDFVKAQSEGDGFASFELSSDQGSWQRLSAREGAHPPELIISGSGASTTPSPENQPPQAVSSALPQQGTAPLTVAFSGDRSYDKDDSIVRHEWDFGDGNSSTEPSPQHTYTAPGSYEAVLTVTDSFGAVSRTHTTIVVGEASTGSSDGDLVLAPVADTYSADGADASSPRLNVSKWTHAHLKFDLASVSSLSQAKLRVFHEGQGTHVGYAWANRNDDWDEQSPRVSDTGFDWNGVPPLDTASITGAGYTEFDVTDYIKQELAGDKMASIELSNDQPGWQAYGSLQGDNPPQLLLIGSNSTSPDPVTPTPEPVNQAPMASFVVSVKQGIAPLATQLDASASSDADGDIVSYAWDFGDGEQGSGRIASHVYQVAGNYRAVLTVTDNGGLTARYEQWINVAAASPDPVVDGGGAPVSLAPVADISSDRPGTEDTLPASEWTHAFIKFDLRDQPVSSRAVLRLYYLGSSNITASVWGNPDHSWDETGQAPKSVGFSWNGDQPLDSASTGAAGYIDLDVTDHVRQAQFADKIVTLELSTNQPGWQRFSARDGDFPPQLILNADGDDNSASTGLTASLEVTGTSGNAPYTVTFNGTGSKSAAGNVARYAWDFGDGNSSTSAQPQHTYTVPGNYTATLTVFDTDNRSATASTVINVRNADIADRDNDGMPDSWEISYGLNPDDPRDATADPDGDGMTNLTEFMMGTLPNVKDDNSMGQMWWGNSISFGPDHTKLPVAEGNAAFDVTHTGETGVYKDGVGAFRNECTASHFSYDDPLVYPGKVNATHLHMFFGNTGTNYASTYTSLRNSGNSTCRGGIANRTAYWVPAMLDANGEPVLPTKIDVYYKTGYNGVAANEVKSIPDGMRILAGAPMGTEPQSSEVINFQCASYSRNAGIIDCKETLKLNVTFPQCWDGKNLDSVDHKSHMAYPRNGCPASHPVALPVISYTVHYPTNGSSKGWRLSSDMYDGKPMGYSAHGDWFGAWDPEIQDTWTRECLNKGLDCASHKLGDGRVIR